MRTIAGGLRLESLLFGLNDPLQFRFRGQVNLVLTHEQLLTQTGRRVADERVVFLRAQNQPDRRDVPRGHFLLAVVVEVHVHLPGVGVGERPELEVDQHVALEDAVVEDQVDEVVVVVEGDALLPRLEAKAAAHLDQKGLQVVDDGLLQVALSVPRPLLQPQKLQHVGVLHHVGDRERLRARVRRQHRGLVRGQARALVEQRVQGPLQRAHRPVVLDRLHFVEGAVQRRVEFEQLDEVRKAQPAHEHRGLDSRQGAGWGQLVGHCLTNCPRRERHAQPLPSNCFLGQQGRIRLVELAAKFQVGQRQPAHAARPQGAGQLAEQAFAVSGPVAALLFVFDHVPADQPVARRQPVVDLLDGRHLRAVMNTGNLVGERGEGGGHWMGKRGNGSKWAGQFAADEDGNRRRTVVA